MEFLVIFIIVFVIWYWFFITRKAQNYNELHNSPTIDHSEIREQVNEYMHHFRFVSVSEARPLSTLNDYQTGSIFCIVIS